MWNRNGHVMTQAQENRASPEHRPSLTVRFGFLPGQQTWPILLARGKKV